MGRGAALLHYHWLVLGKPLVLLAFGIGGVVSLMKSFRIIRNYQKTMATDKKIRQRQQDRKVQLQELETRLTSLLSQDPPLENTWARIHRLGFKELVQELKSKKIQAKEVLRAYQYFVIAAHKQTNAVTEFLSEAEEWADQLDAATEPVGALHGVPVSVKENFAIQGHDVTLGFGKYMSIPYEDDAEVITLLRSLGAIPFVRTGFPQSLISFDSGNPVYGSVLNPHDQSRTAGGSSSGEGALMGMGASILGIGSDVGGSGRIPIHFCGGFSLKPSYGRLSDVGEIAATQGLVGVNASPAILSRELQALVETAKLLMDDQRSNERPTTPFAVPVSFNETALKSTQKLRIGFYEYDGFIQAVPACRRAVRMAAKALEQMGHTLVRVDTSKMEVESALREYMLKFLFAERNKTLLAHFKDGERVDPGVKFIVDNYRMNLHLRKLLMNTVARWTTPLIHRMVPTDELSVTQLWKLNADRKAYIMRVIKYWREELRIDACIMPPCGVSAVKLGSPGYLLPVASYTALYNVLDFPAGVLPVTKWTKEDEQQMETDYPKGIRPREDVYRRTQADSVGSVGLPVGVQVVAPRWEDEVVLRVMKDVEEVLFLSPLSLIRSGRILVLIRSGNANCRSDVSPILLMEEIVDSSLDCRAGLTSLQLRHQRATEATAGLPRQTNTVGVGGGGTGIMRGVVWEVSRWCRVIKADLATYTMGKPWKSEKEH
ncbi:unnamed protein product [Cyprideis torosa]|uniref:Uncharacterized protein n=1 Tax=Cyprideis torosa TaxID=163714 RepID=A0A7R8W7P1_9CRUS|nr:unnamed protein product [Cyprideis torosa]CAG0887768.1 unnamed protein product [Cyprideis torosa]